MNEQTIVEKKRNSPTRGAGGGQRGSYSVADKLKAVRLHTKEGFSQAQGCRELNFARAA
jgi:hypothetical protein